MKRLLLLAMLAAFAFCRTGNPGWDAYKYDKPYKKLFDIQ